MLIFCDCDGNVDDDDDLVVTLVYKDAPSNIDFNAEFGDLKRTKKSAAPLQWETLQHCLSQFPCSRVPFNLLDV